ncbi:YtxH domain-containing protein [Cellulomonas sp. KRMCY2]|uniref:YtxH domain-containing protein n=1 Tax=Cellulomonas sp. KRMCY2 TaxID=1304865 RepID=UPI00045E6549|nr:YtxH domain-containing protein [Cellulomonas sp. KRMCY2]
MRAKAAFVIGGAVGYVLGTRAGREQFEKIRLQAKRVWEDPRVQETVSDVEQRAEEFIREVAPDLKDKVAGAVRSATDAVRPSKDESASSTWDIPTGYDDTTRPNGSPSGL